MNDQADQRPALSAVTMAVAASLVLERFARVSMGRCRYYWRRRDRLVGEASRKLGRSAP
jgi:hypothetical protein